MKLHELQPSPGSHHSRKRVGRGPGSGHGKTATRGQKGQRARTSVNLPKTFEGGQTRLTTAPIADNWRAFAVIDYADAHPDIGMIGPRLREVELLMERGSFDVGASADSPAKHRQAGRIAEVVWQTLVVVVIVVCRKSDFLAVE